MMVPLSLCFLCQKFPQQIRIGDDSDRLRALIDDRQTTNLPAQHQLGRLFQRRMECNPQKIPRARPMPVNYREFSTTTEARLARLEKIVAFNCQICEVRVDRPKSLQRRQKISSEHPIYLGPLGDGLTRPLGRERRHFCRPRAPCFSGLVTQVPEMTAMPRSGRFGTGCAHQSW